MFTLRPWATQRKPAERSHIQRKLHSRRRRRGACCRQHGRASVFCQSALTSRRTSLPPEKQVSTVLNERPTDRTMQGSLERLHGLSWTMGSCVSGCGSCIGASSGQQQQL